MMGCLTEDPRLRDAISKALAVLLHSQYQSPPKNLLNKLIAKCTQNPNTEAIASSSLDFTLV
jgi:hypothetical protein